MNMWRKLKLPECIEMSPKAKKIPKKRFLASGLYPIVSQEKSLVNGYWNDSDDVVSIDKPVVVFGDHTQVLKLVDFDFVVGADGVKILKPRAFLDAKYLYYFLQGHRIKELGYARHFRLLKELDIKFPPLPEQKRIVTILDEAFAGVDVTIANTKKNLANARELFERYLNTRFAQGNEKWVEEKLMKFIDIKHGFAFKSKDFRISDNIDKPIVLTPGNYTPDGRLYFTKKNTKRLMVNPPEEFLFSNGDLTIVMTDLSSQMKILGKPAFIEADNILHNQRIGRIEPISNDINSRFIYYFLMSQRAVREIQESATGTTVRHTAPKRILGINISFPISQSEQEAIVSACDELKQRTLDLEFLYQQKLHSLEELKQSLLQKAFSGDLTSAALENSLEEAVA